MASPLVHGTTGHPLQPPLTDGALGGWMVPTAGGSLAFRHGVRVFSDAR